MWLCVCVCGGVMYVLFGLQYQVPFLVHTPSLLSETGSFTELIQPRSFRDPVFSALLPPALGYRHALLRSTFPVGLGI